MSEQTLFPSYIERGEEHQIRAEVAKVQESHNSRAILLYGPGGVGKTQLVRHLAEPSPDDQQVNADDQLTIWLKPVDIDDSEYWLLSNLEQRVVEQLDPSREYFGPYLEYLSRLPNYTRPRIGHETVVSHLGRIKNIFVECYKKFIADTGKTIIIVFDTVEIIRGTYLLLTLTQWMKALPATLFILSGRPPSDDREDPIRTEIDDPYQRIPVTAITLGSFSLEKARTYIDQSGVASGLVPEEKEKIVRLTRGHPLWLAFTVDYLRNTGLPKEAVGKLADIERDLPYQGAVPAAGLKLLEEFRRSLVAPYRDTDFLPESIKRLAVVRASINQPIWRQLMGDLRGSDRIESDEGWAQAWKELLATPWIRPRANRQYVTLHDAVAEELALRIIPLHDQDGQWRHQLWQRAAGIYDDLIEHREAELDVQLVQLDGILQIWDATPRRGETLPHNQDEVRFIAGVTQLEAQKRELRQLKAIRLYYEMLRDPQEGCRLFLKLFEQATDEHDILFQELLALEMQRFLPVGVQAHPLDDVIGQVITQFREWLITDGQQLYLEVGLSMADYLIKSDQPKTAVSLLNILPASNANPTQRYRLSNLLGNAGMRIPGLVKDARRHFEAALEEARQLKSGDRLKLIATAHKELGFYFRNEGLWEDADYAYQQARDAISQILARGGGSPADREEMASIQTNWAYLKGLNGNYRDGINLAESSITIRHRLNNPEEGISWSVCGEIYRYERRFQKAWKAYAEAEQIFQGQRNWSWLGQLYQQQAICMYQANEDGVVVAPGRDSIEHAKFLAIQALDLCGDLAVRGQPSALNRAGRIFGRDEPDRALGYLSDGVELARNLSDGWLWFSNLIEYVELSYLTWVKTENDAYRAQIADRADQIAEVMAQYKFLDLQGRWDLVQGHLKLHDWHRTRDPSYLSAALEHYKEGFAQVAQGYVGSSGIAAVASEFQTFKELVWNLPLPDDVREEWQEELRGAWAGLPNGSTLLLARLEELY